MKGSFANRTLYVLLLPRFCSFLCEIARTDRCPYVNSLDTVRKCVDGVCGAPRPVTFARVYEEILVPYGCTSGRCHGAAAGYLSLGTAEDSYANLVRASATAADCGSGVRVAPGDVTGSLMWLKVAPDMNVCGSKMPPTMGGLPAPALTLLREWITAGAPR